MPRWSRVLVSCSILWCGASLHAQDSGSDRLNGRQRFVGCVTCHGRPDPTLRSDSLWIDRVQETACVQPLGPKSAPLRRAIQDYLRSPSDVPRRVSEAAAAGENEGLISFARAENVSILLVPESGGVPVRLLWTRDQKGEPRAVPAGKYKVQQYAVTRRDARGSEWQMWASGPKGRTVEVKGAEPAKLDLDLRVHFRSTASHNERGLQLGVAPTGDHKMGVTIVKDGQRIEAGYRLLAGDRKLAQGALKYG